MLKKNKADVLALFETHAGGENARKICHGLGFDNSFRVDAVGQRGGLWLLWRTEVGEVAIVDSSDQFIYVTIIKDQERTHLVSVYAAPTVTRRSGIWNSLGTLLKDIEEPLIVGGDFNSIVRLDERTGGNGCLSADSVEFGDWINGMSLIDLGFRGSCFTWRRGRSESVFVAKRLDRILCNGYARMKWQDASVTHLPFLSSDHSPLFVQMCPEVLSNPQRRPFRFEAAWLQHTGFKELLLNSWNPNISTPLALKRLQFQLQKWNREVFGDIHKRKEKLLTDLKAVQDEITMYVSDALISREVDLARALDDVLAQEEVLWYQKSREKWVEMGDRNTKFFHTSTVVRRKINRVEMLQNSVGQWISDPGELESMAVEYYRKLYSMEDVEPTVCALPSGGFTPLTEAEVQILSSPFTGSDIEVAIRSMSKYKAPGPDGYQPVFYHESWDVVGDSVISFALDFFRSGQLPSGMNDALVVLIPKIGKPENMTQFRPISLCNVLFKIITKAMVMRLKMVIPKLVGPAQVSFIPGRLSTDNILVVQEVVHSFKRKKGKDCSMLLKLDLEKAYDRIRWDFLEDTIRATGLPDMWITWIMQSVSGLSMNLLWNGERTSAIKPSRGLRQGDPLSPYLFVLCLERLCHLIDRAVDNKEWKPISLTRGGPMLSHLCFADDLILFAEASVAQIQIIRDVLEQFCVASGQKVSLAKSVIYFSENMDRELAKAISNVSGIKPTTNLGKYLGLPVLHNRVNKETFGGVVEQISSRLAGWKGKFLSFAGRITLTKAVLSSIPVHTMSTIILPQSTLKEIDRISRYFLWGSSADTKKQHLVNWKHVCKPRRESGLGIRVASGMNKALIAKVGWRLLHDKESLWARLLRTKYKVKDTKDKAWLLSKGSWSSSWRGICIGLRDVVFPNLRWVVGNGENVKFWTDAWLQNVPLADCVTNPLPANLSEVSVSDMWQNNLGWSFDVFMTYVPDRVRLQLGSIVLDHVTGAKDRLSWRGTSNGVFSVSSAYGLHMNDNVSAQNMSGFFDRIWKARVPERLRAFMWLVSHQVLMTNAERTRRHLCSSSIYSVCKAGEETILHVLRDCQAMSGIWGRVVPRQKQSVFFSQSLFQWLFTNLEPNTTVNGVLWSTLFAVGVWWGWKWRCGNVFGSTVKCRDRTQFVKDKAIEFHAILARRHTILDTNASMEVLVAWKRPQVKWFRLNTDGASRGNPGLATAGGVIRNSEGAWCRGFCLNIGICSAPLAELWGVYYGLYMAWEMGISRLGVEIDSELVVGFLTKGIGEPHPLSFLVRLCYGFLVKDWIVRINHVFREANRLADGLANHAYDMSLGFHLFHDAPPCVLSLLEDDVSGLAVPRRIRNGDG